MAYKEDKMAYKEDKQAGKEKCYWFKQFSVPLMLELKAVHEWTV